VDESVTGSAKLCVGETRFLLRGPLLRQQTRLRAGGSADTGRSVAGWKRGGECRAEGVRLPAVAGSRAVPEQIGRGERRKSWIWIGAVSEHGVAGDLVVVGDRVDARVEDGDIRWRRDECDADAVVRGDDVVGQRDSVGVDREQTGAAGRRERRSLGSVEGFGRAAAVPFANNLALGLVSRRTGNYESNPEWGVLLDLLWVR